MDEDFLNKQLLQFMPFVQEVFNLFYIVNYHIKWVKTSWTYSIYLNLGKMAGREILTPSIVRLLPKKN